jgi:hypothetical protein
MMVRQSDSDYYAARLSAELEAMARAASEVARAAHQALAESYRQRLADNRISEEPEAA